jgi:hypothetical protein
MKWSHFKALPASLLIALAGITAPAGAADPSPLDYAMYFNSEVKDSPECRMSVKDGEIVTPEELKNVSMTCPDMFSWQLFTEVVRGAFWSRWADERQNWPAEPYPLCDDPDKPGSDCCTPKHPDKNPEGHCPMFPGDAGRSLLRIGRQSVMEHHNPALERDVKLLERRLEDKARRIRQKRNETPSCRQVGIGPGDIITPELIAGAESIGRVVRQTNAEVTVRNRSFHDYVFRNNLYNADGVADVWLNHQRNLTDNAPYRGGSGELSKVDFPADAIMIKSNWLHEGLAKQLDIKNRSGHEFISKHMVTRINYEADKHCNLDGTHYLMAFHISSKDIPEWVWTTFEHIEMPGRCDIIGCNDAYGYRNPGDLPEGAADNYIAPHTQSDGLNSPSVVFDRDKKYAAEPIRPGLKSVLDGLKIGVAPAADETEPRPRDRAWRNYRLKGSQVNFVDKTGRPTMLGNSITEAGFMDGSSCMTCHARAGIRVKPQAGAKKQACENPILGGDYCYTFFGLGVFENNVSDFGYSRSAHGTPEPNWYYQSATPPDLNVMQVDFAWGFLFASPLVK